MFVISTLARRLHGTLEAVVRQVLGRHQARHPGTLLLLNLLWGRLQRLLRRLDSFVLRVERDLGARPCASPRPRAPRQAPKPELRLPIAPGWLARMIPDGHMCPGYICAFLEAAETRAFYESAPQAGRILRPLARLVGLPLPAWLALPKRPRKPRPKAEPKPRPRLRPLSFTRAQIDRMTAAELTAIYGRLPPHFPLPIRNLNHIRRKIAAG